MAHLGHLSGTVQYIPSNERKGIPDGKMYPFLFWNATGIQLIGSPQKDILEMASEDPRDYYKWWDIWLSGEDSDDIPMVIKQEEEIPYE